MTGLRPGHGYYPPRWWTEYCTEYEEIFNLEKDMDDKVVTGIEVVDEVTRTFRCGGLMIVVKMAGASCELLECTVQVVHEDRKQFQRLDRAQLHKLTAWLESVDQLVDLDEDED